MTMFKQLLPVIGLLLAVQACANTASGQRFDRAIKAYEDALANRDNISLALYAEGARELQGMIRKFGKIFSFADSEFGKLVTNLEQVGKSSPSSSSSSSDEEEGGGGGGRNPAYETIQSAIDYELQQKLANKKLKKPTAIKAVADLLWALKYLSSFMQKLSTMDDGEGTASAAKRAYSELFGKKHSWLIRTAVNLGARALPKKRSLVQKMMDDDEECAENEELRNKKLAKFASVSRELIEQLDRFYAEKNLD